MEQRKLTKADIDKVRHIEGFPIAKDEDIIALSRPPYYTTCPNPFIADFIAEHGTPYDEATDDYHREPFAADVSEGKTDPIYMAHSYHTKVPYKAIMRYILHYTNPGDLVFDGFCGTGMTGIAAQMCGSPEPAFKAQLEAEMSDIHWGARRAILNDLSPAATFIAFNYNDSVDASLFEKEALRILGEAEADLGWMYETRHVDSVGEPVIGIDGRPVMGKINYVVWSDVFICPSCSEELVYWDRAVEANGRQVGNGFTCPKCGTKLKKSDCQRAQVSYFDAKLGKTLAVSKQTPTLISYIALGKKFEKRPDEFDLELIEKCSAVSSPTWYPFDYIEDGDNASQAKISHHFDYVHQYYYDRSLIVFSQLWDKATRSICSNTLRFLITSVLVKTGSKFHNIGIKDGKINLAGQMPNVLFVPSSVAERNIIDLVRGKLKDILPVFTRAHANQSIISVGDASDTMIPDKCIDYIFVDINTSIPCVINDHYEPQDPVAA